MSYSELAPLWLRVLEQLPRCQAFNTLLKHRHIEIDEEPKRKTCEFQVGQQLGFMQRYQISDCFDLYHDYVFNDEVQAIPAIQPNAFVNEWQGLLPFELEIDACKLKRKAFVVSGFQQTRTERTMDVHRKSNNPSAELIQPLCLCVSVVRSSGRKFTTTETGNLTTEAQRGNVLDALAPGRLPAHVGPSELQSLSSVERRASQFGLCVSVSLILQGGNSPSQKEEVQPQRHRGTEKGKS